MFHLDSLYKPMNAKTRSISAENPNGAKGGGARAIPTESEPISRAARELGEGWKVRPCITLKAGETVTLADISGSGIITHIWMTFAAERRRDLILRFWWDGEDTPSVEVPAGDFFCSAYPEFFQISSLPICVNPLNGLNSYWQMPFRKGCRITLENDSEEKFEYVFYQIDYLETEVDADAMYFHAQFRRENPVPYQKEYTILDNIKGKGHFLGMYLTWSQHNRGWWGEGEVKFYIDGDSKYPTYCGTGTEDYFGGAWGFENKERKDYQTYTTPFLGFPQYVKAEGFYAVPQRYGLYRWHIADPVLFETDFKATIQALGWRKYGRYLPLQDDLSSVAYWYQAEPHATFPEFPDANAREII